MVNEETNNAKAGTSSTTAPKTSNYSSNSSTESENSLDFEANDKSKKSSIRVGKDYQADLQVIKNPPLDTQLEKTSEIIVWKPNPTLSEQDLKSYVFAVCQKCSYSIEQSLCLLQSNNYDLRVAHLKSRDFMPTPDEWTTEDKIIFEQAFNIYGKNFYKIKQCLPDKKQGSVVNHYYMWKKSRGHVSMIQQQTEQQQNGKNNFTKVDTEIDSIGANLNGQNQNNETDTEETNFTNITKICSNCDLITDDLQSTPKGVLCNLCYAYYKNTSGLMRPDNLNTMNGAFNSSKSNPTNGKLKSGKLDAEHDSDLTKRTEHAKEARNFQKSLRKPPKGIYLNYDELVSLAEFDYKITFDMLDKRLVCLKQEVQANKQQIRTMIEELTNDYDNNALEIDPDLIKIESVLFQTPLWNAHEITLAIQGFNKYGTDFEAISEVMGTKNERAIKSFYQYQKDHYNLEKLVSNPIEIKNESTMIFNELNKLNRPDLPTSTSSVMFRGSESNLN